MFALETAFGSGLSTYGKNPSRQWAGFLLSDWDQFKQDAREIMAQAVSSKRTTGRLVGILSYELGLRWEGVVSRHAKAGEPLFHFGLYDEDVGYEALFGEVSFESPGAVSELTRDHDAASYAAMVVQALDLIRAGEIYEVNLSRRFSCLADTSRARALSLYQKLKQGSPAPYAGFYDTGNLAILSVSPELFLRKDGQRVLTRPMKGTRPRGGTVEEDIVLHQELLDSAKEQAELLMVTDLLRNDLGKVCTFGSVQVDTLRHIEPYPGVFQAMSTVSGELAGSNDIFDVIEAAFPGGSVTGCPKRRAMEVVDALESSRRGFYTGALGYINLNGDAAFNVLIRSMVLQDGRLTFATGGGIVADSHPGQEYEETEIKARAMKKVLGQ